MTDAAEQLEDQEPAWGWISRPIISLSYPQFRLFWLSNLIVAIGMMVQFTARGSRMVDVISRARASLAAAGWQSAAVYAAPLACIILSFAVYWPSVDDYFVWDDFFFLRAVRNYGFWKVMARAFTFPQGQLFDEATAFWRPSIDLYFYLAKPFGIHAQPFHVVNIALHGIVGGLAVIFVRRITRSVATGIVTGLLFTAASTYDYAVTWVAQVSELLGAALILAALLSYHAYLTADKSRPLYAAAATLLTLFALLTKETTVILVALLPALTLALSAEERRRSTPEILRSLAPPVLLGVVYALAMELHEYSQPGHFHTFGPHMARNVWRYLKWMVLPFRYGWAPTAREAAAGAFLALGVATLLLKQRRLGFLFVWTVVAIMPFTGFGDWIELRYTYLATLPFVAFVVSGLVALVNHVPRPLSLPAAAILALAVAVALVVTPLRTRDQQSFFAREAANYEQMVDSVRDLCGTLPPESFVYIVGAPYSDLWGIHTPSAVNLYYERVHAAAVPELPGLAAFIEQEKCVIEYDPQSGEYTRVE